jgi:hypothetical protein
MSGQEYGSTNKWTHLEEDGAILLVKGHTSYCNFFDNSPTIRLRRFLWPSIVISRASNTESSNSMIVSNTSNLLSRNLSQYWLIPISLTTDAGVVNFSAKQYYLCSLTAKQMHTWWEGGRYACRCWGNNVVIVAAAFPVMILNPAVVVQVGGSLVFCGVVVGVTTCCSNVSIFCLVARAEMWDCWEHLRLLSLSTSGAVASRSQKSRSSPSNWNGYRANK